MQEAPEYVCGNPRWPAAIPTKHQQQELRLVENLCVSTFAQGPAVTSKIKAFPVKAQPQRIAYMVLYLMGQCFCPTHFKVPMYENVSSLKSIVLGHAACASLLQEAQPGTAS